MRRMGPEIPKWFMILSVCWLYKGVTCNSVEQKIYVALNNTVPCVRLLNATHQIGCQSLKSGSTGVLHVLQSEADLDWVLSTGPHPPYMVFMEASFFNNVTMMRLKNSTRVAGVAVVIPNTGPAQGYSPHTGCPNQNTGVYSEKYGPLLANCNNTIWNPLGNGLSYEDFRFPIFSLKDDNETEVIRKCFEDHNVAANGSAPQYPLCAMQLFSHMSAVIDTPTCMRRNHLQNSFSINPDMVCDPLRDYNVIAYLRPVNTSTKGHKANESVVIAATRLDGRSFFWDIAPAAEGTVAGFVTLLAAAHALFPVAQEVPPPRNILFTFFQGETFDYIGSSRMVYDMQNKKFEIDLDNVHSVLELGQVGLWNRQKLWMHSDPISRLNSSVEEEVGNLVNNIKFVASQMNLSVEEPSVSQALPPSSFQRFLRVRPIPGIVIADHEAAFVNRYYESIYDNAEYLNVAYPSNMSETEQLDTVTDTARSLAEAATLVARSLYKQAGGSDPLLSNITADPKIVTQLLYGFLIQPNNSWFRALFRPDHQQVLKGVQSNYVGVRMPENAVKESTLLFQYILANLTGKATNLTQSQCQNPSDLPEESKDLYSYMWVKGPVSANETEGSPYCVRASTRLHEAYSPAFLLSDYASKEYSTWTESRWKVIKARIFLVASQELEMLTLGVGVAVLLVSLLVTYFMSSKAEILFSSARETSTTTY